MDTSIFIRTRWHVWAWRVAPLAAAVLAGTGGALYCARCRQDIQWRRTFFEVMPELRTTLEVAVGTISNGFRLSRSSAEARERLSVALTEAAQRHKFTVNSLQIEEAKGGGGALQATVRGDALFAAMVRFAAEVERPENLLTVDQFVCSVQQAIADPLYQAEYVIRYAFNPK